MVIYETMTCSKCLITYRGIFELTIEGTIKCIDCDNKQYLEEVTIRNLERVSDVQTEEEDTAIRELYYKFLEKDLRLLYNTEYEHGESIPETLFEDGEISLNPFYFHNNPIDIVIDYHRLAYKGFNLIGETKDEVQEVAYNLVKMYKKLREYKLTEEDEIKYRNYITDMSVMELIEYVELYGG